jgi:hypothetical protein
VLVPVKGMRVQVPPRTQIPLPMLWDLDLGFDQLSARVVGQPQVELPEDLRLVVGIGVSQD